MDAADLVDTLDERAVFTLTEAEASTAGLAVGSCRRADHSKCQRNSPPFITEQLASPKVCSLLSAKPTG